MSIAFCPGRKKAYRIPVRLLAILAAATLPGAALAGSVQIDPVKIEINADRKTGSVRIRNTDAKPVTMRGFARSWSQVNGEDVHEDAADVIVSPPVFTIPAGGSQLVRVGLRSAIRPGSYRLILEEMPEASPNGGVQVALRLDMPLYAMEKPGAADDLVWTAWQQADKNWVVEATNKGDGYVRVEPEEASSASGMMFDASRALGTVLPGGSKKWLVGSATIIDRARFEQIVRARDGNDRVRLASTH
jgi:fimbrial chaperone protein